MLFKGIISSYDVGTHTCDVAIVGGTYALFQDVRVADNIDAADVAANNYCVIVRLSNDPADLIIIAGWEP